MEVFTLRKLIYIGITAAAVLLAACSPLNPPNAEQFQSGDLNNDNIQVKNEGPLLEGEITDIADRNPNFLRLNGNTDKGHVNNIGLLQDKIRESVEESDIFEPGLIYMNGSNAVVHVTPVKSYTKEQVRELESKIQLDVPKYHIRVNVNGNE